MARPLLAALTALLLAACATPDPEAAPVDPRGEPPAGDAEGQAPPRLPSTREGIGGRIAEGARVDLTDARLFVPEGAIPADGPVPLSLHFQGGPIIAEENFVRSERRGVLVASTLSGLSSAFRVPYEDPAAFRALLDEAAVEVARLGGREVPPEFDPVTITFFSAGYGAVREFLRVPEHFELIDHLVSADSIYAEVVAPDVRAPAVHQVSPFMRFAQAAARGEKTFVLAHTMVPTPYASTAECAAMVLAAVGEEVGPPVRAYTERGVPIAGEVHVGGLHVYRFDEADAGIHVDCLYMIPELVRRHVPGGAP